MINKIKLVAALLLVAAGVAGFYFLADYPLVVRVVTVLAGTVAAVAVMLTTAEGQVAFNFAREAVVETRKVVWPTREETVRTTLIVFVVVVLIAIFLWIVDLGFLWAVEKFLGRSA